jgi:hypothetical protein
MALYPRRLSSSVIILIGNEEVGENSAGRHANQWHGGGKEAGEKSEPIGARNRKVYAP